MWKGILIAVSVLVAVCLVLTVVHPRMLFADAYSYGPGQPVVLSIVNVGMLSCTCTDPSLKLFRLENGSWKRVLYATSSFKGDGMAGGCADGQFSPISMCDLVVCTPSPLFRIGGFTWDREIYVEDGTVSYCGGQELSMPIDSYVRIPAPAGAYKFTYGSSSAHFAIR